MIHEQLGWLNLLVSSYRDEHDWDRDEDPLATIEMLAECQRLHDELAARVAPDIVVEPKADALPAGGEIPF